MNKDKIKITFSNSDKVMIMVSDTGIIVSAYKTDTESVLNPFYQRWYALNDAKSVIRSIKSKNYSDKTKVLVLFPNIGKYVKSSTGDYEEFKRMIEVYKELIKSIRICTKSVITPIDYTNFLFKGLRSDINGGVLIG